MIDWEEIVMKRILVFSFQNLVAAVCSGDLSDDQLHSGLYCLDVSFDEAINNGIESLLHRKIAHSLIDAHGASRAIWGNSSDLGSINAMLQRNGFPQYAPVAGEAFSIGNLEAWIAEEKINLRVV
jgi:hypothetical protein